MGEVESFAVEMIPYSGHLLLCCDTASDDRELEIEVSHFQAANANESLAGLPKTQDPSGMKRYENLGETVWEIEAEIRRSVIFPPSRRAGPLLAHSSSLCSAVGLSDGAEVQVNRSTRSEFILADEDVASIITKADSWSLI